jgi:hypothetical protein
MLLGAADNAEKALCHHGSPNRRLTIAFARPVQSVDGIAIGTRLCFLRLYFL